MDTGTIGGYGGEKHEHRMEHMGRSQAEVAFVGMNRRDNVPRYGVFVDERIGPEYFEANKQIVQL